MPSAALLTREAHAPAAQVQKKRQKPMHRTRASGAAARCPAAPAAGRGVAALCCCSSCSISCMRSVRMGWRRALAGEGAASGEASMTGRAALGGGGERCCRCPGAAAGAIGSRSASDHRASIDQGLRSSWQGPRAARGRRGPVLGTDRPACLQLQLAWILKLKQQQCGCRAAQVCQGSCAPWQCRPGGPSSACPGSIDLCKQPISIIELDKNKNGARSRPRGRPTRWGAARAGMPLLHVGPGMLGRVACTAETEACAASLEAPVPPARRAAAARRGAKATCSLPVASGRQRGALQRAQTRLRRRGVLPPDACAPSPPHRIPRSDWQDCARPGEGSFRAAALQPPPALSAASEA